jgi:hypothetical protein
MVRVAERIGACRVLVGRREGKSYLEDLGVDGSRVLKRMIKK